MREKKNTNVYKVSTLLIILLIFIVPINTINAKDSFNDISQTIDIFKNSIENGNYLTFKTLVGSEGLIIIRSFVSGNGTRGKDIREKYSAREIPHNIQFPVNGEVPINLKELLKGTIETPSKNIIVKKFEKVQFDFNKMTTSEIWNICGKIRCSVDTKNEWTPLIICLSGDQYVLTESTVDFNIGEWVVFKKVEKKYYVIAIMDFR